MEKSSDQCRRKRIGVDLSLVGPASRQYLDWIEETKRIALGTYHYTTPTLHPGQWVRFIGDPRAVKGRMRDIPRLGSYGQVWRRETGSSHRLYVVFLGASHLFRLSAFELEPLVGRPVGQPRDHLRRVMRRLRGYRRSSGVTKGAQR